jgi:GTPase SAR1 family protein
VGRWPFWSLQTEEERDHRKMISFTIGMWELMCSRPEVKVLLAGPTASGKTTVGELLKRGIQPKGPHVDLENVVTPTIGMNVVRAARVGAVDMTVLDVGGTMRSLWPRYLQEDCDAVIFVFDVATPIAPKSGAVPSFSGSLGLHSSASGSGSGNTTGIEAALEEARLALAQVMDKAPPDLLVILLGTHSNSLTHEQRELAANVLKSEVMRGRQKARDRWDRDDNQNDAEEDEDNEAAVIRRDTTSSAASGSSAAASAAAAAAVASSIAIGNLASSKPPSVAGAALMPLDSRPSIAAPTSNPPSRQSSSAAVNSLIAASSLPSSGVPRPHYPGHLHALGGPSSLGHKMDKISPRYSNESPIQFEPIENGYANSSHHHGFSTRKAGAPSASNDRLMMTPSTTTSSSSNAFTTVDLTAFLGPPPQPSLSSSRVGGSSSGAAGGGRSVGGIINAAAAAHQLIDQADLEFEASLLASSNPSGSSVMLRRAPSGGGVVAGGSNAAGGASSGSSALSSVVIADGGLINAGSGGASAAPSAAAPGTESKHKQTPSLGAQKKAKATPRQEDRRSKARLLHPGGGVHRSSFDGGAAAAEPPRMVWVDAFLSPSSGGGGRRTINPEAPSIIRDLFEWTATTVQYQG